MKNLANYWWFFAINGVLMILFGLMAIIFPEITFLALLVYFGALLIIIGAIGIIGSFASKKHGAGWGYWLFESVLALAAGLLLVLFPNVGADLLIIFIAVWAIFTGIVNMINMFAFRVFSGWNVAYAILAILFGVLLLIDPFAGGSALAMLLGIFALIFGISLSAKSFSIRKYRLGD